MKVRALNSEFVDFRDLEFNSGAKCTGKQLIRLRRKVEAAGNASNANAF